MVGSPISLLSGPQDPSQLEAVANSIITSINAYLSGQSSIVSVVTAGTTASGGVPASGTVAINSTTRTAGTTGRYTLPAPVRGQTLTIKNLSTVKATLTGLFERSKTKLSMTSTAALGSVNLPGVMLRGLSTSAWGVLAQTGKILTT